MSGGSSEKFPFRGCSPRADPYHEVTFGAEAIRYPKEFSTRCGRIVLYCGEQNNSYTPFSDDTLLHNRSLVNKAEAVRHFACMP
jgi:hypothetical protein